MKKTNKVLAGLALMTALVGQAKAQEMGLPEKDAETNVVAVATAPQSTNDVVTVETTNTVADVVAPTVQETNTNNVVVVETTNTVAAATNTVETAVETKTEAEPVLTDFQKALLQEVAPQIKPFVMKDGMTDAQLFILGAQMHLEENVGTRALCIQYWKAAEAGMDLAPFEAAYQARLKEQQDFMKACQEGIADARINHQDSFKMSGVSFNINSTNLVENLLTFKIAKDEGQYSVIIEGQPFKIFRTPEELKRMSNTAQAPNMIVTPYGTYIRQAEQNR